MDRSARSGRSRIVICNSIEISDVIVGIGVCRPVRLTQRREVDVCGVMRYRSSLIVPELAVIHSALPGVRCTYCSDTQQDQ